MVGPSLDTTNRHLKQPSSTATTIKFLCSYGGKIIPRYPDGKLRYYGGETRVLAVDRSISFSELLLKLEELCGTRVSLRCQLPKEDLDALVSITSDEDLANLIEEYDRAATPKIRAFLSTPKKISSPSSPSASSSSSSSSSSSPSNSYVATVGSTDSTSTHRCYHQISKPVVCPVKKILPHPHYCYHVHGNRSHAYMVRNGNHWLTRRFWWINMKDDGESYMKDSPLWKMHSWGIINPSSLREEVGMARISNQKTLVAFFNCVEIISRSDSDEIQLKLCLPEFIEHEKDIP